VRAPVVAALAAAVALALAGCGGDDPEQSAAGTEPTPTAAETGATGPGGCRDVEQPEPKAEGALEAPTEELDPAKTYDVVVSTSCGDFTITMDQKASPKGTASFVSLAREGFFDGTFFHRIVPEFVIQGGDPTGTGTGGPGYSTVDPPAANTSYEFGVVAMAKTGAEPPGTAGSQFFVVTADDAGLPPDYAVIGKVTRGIDVVQRIGLLGDPNIEQPTQPIVVDRMTVEES
jgi:peptidyl-prolyl cis-trans isomerase B (cyclophilin B)